MAIEFHCPYCTVAIRVADGHAGKRGTCPKCSTKLIVPELPRPAAAAAEVRPEEMTLVPTPAAEPLTPAFVPPVSAPSVARTLKSQRRRHRSQKLFSVGVPVLFLLLFAGTFAGMMKLLNRTPELTGSLTGHSAGDESLPVAKVDASSLRLTPDEASAVLSDLEADPAAFLSSQMHCRISAQGGALVVSLSPGNGFRWFVVNPSGNRDLIVWIRDHRAELDRQRAAELTAAGEQFCRDRLKLADGERVVLDAARYRDELGLNAHCDAFGYAVEAIADNRVSRCAHEDADGNLYFALPEKTVSFTLTGRKLTSAAMKFPGTYVVEVEGSIAPPAEDASPGGDSGKNDADAAPAAGADVPAESGTAEIMNSDEAKD